MAGLNKLEDLDLYSNQISDISPLAGLTSLETLSVTSNQVRDISALAGLVDLELLWLWENEIRDITPLTGLKELRNPDLSDNQISDISPLAGLQGLDHLALENNRIYDVSPLAGLTQLTVLNLADNLITDISPLVGLTHLKRLELQGNPLDPSACKTHIPLIQAANPGITLTYDACHGSLDFPLSAARVIYVDCDAPGQEDGTGWRHAYQNLQDALTDADVSEKPVEIRVAQGTYRPDQGKDQISGNRQTAFQLANGVIVAGGYAGYGESDPNTRDTLLYATVLSGDLMGNDQDFVYAEELFNDSTRSDNSYTVVIGSATDTSAVLDGFTVTGGHQRGGVFIDSGSSVTLECEDECTAFIVNCILSGNDAETGGGILCDDGSEPTINHCVIAGNRAYEMDKGGGGLYCENTAATVTNCTIVGNLSTNGGGVYCDRYGSPTMVNCILWDNSALRGPQIALTDDVGPSTLIISYSDVQGGLENAHVGFNCSLTWGQGNIDINPRFAAPGHWDPNNTPDDPSDDFWVDGDYHMKSEAGRWEPNARAWVMDSITSPCIDAGDPSFSVGAESTPHGGRINMGAYGGTSEASMSASASISGNKEGFETGDFSKLDWVFYGDAFWTVTSGTSHSGEYSARAGEQPVVTRAVMDCVDGVVDLYQFAAPMSQFSRAPFSSQCGFGPQPQSQ